VISRLRRQIAFPAGAGDGALGVRAVLMPGLEPGVTIEDGARALEAFPRLEPAGGDDFLAVGPVKVVADGGVETNFLREPYAFADDPSAPRGKPRVSPENLTAVCRLAAGAGRQLGVHCVGDAAIDLVLDAVEAADREQPDAPLRWTIHMTWRAGAPSAPGGSAWRWPCSSCCGLLGMAGEVLGAERRHSLHRASTRKWPDRGAGSDACDESHLAGACPPPRGDGGRARPRSGGDAATVLRSTPPAAPLLLRRAAPRLSRRMLADLTVVSRPAASPAARAARCPGAPNRGRKVRYEG
jgi:hypothetical protein